MKREIGFSSRVGDRWTFAIEFEGSGDPPRVWNEWWGCLWLWIDGRLVGRPTEIEMVMTGLDSLVESVQQAVSRNSTLLSSRPPDEALNSVMRASYVDYSPGPESPTEDTSLLQAHEVLPRLTGAFFDGWEAILIEENVRERFIFRQEGGGAVGEAFWPVGTFKKIVLQAR